MPESSPPIPLLPASSSPASSGRATRSLSQRHQWLLLVGLALVVCAALGFGWLREHVYAAHAEHKGEAAAETASPGTFRPTSAQLATLKIAPVASVTFRTEQVTDGKIALNGDKITPVFSPYSGRVTKVLAHLGDNVKQGQPLLAIDATEFVQGQNDLVVAVNSVKTAHAQVALAQTNEQRKHALFDAKGGSLQDWQQSQSDLVAAQNTLRSAETALALVRNRLRILGKTDTEISALENERRGIRAGTDRRNGHRSPGRARPIHPIGCLQPGVCDR